MSLMAPTPADEQRRRGLRRMRTLAVSLLILAAVIFLATLRLPHDGYAGAGAPNGAPPCGCPKPEGGRFCGPWFQSWLMVGAASHGRGRAAWQPA